MSVKQSLNKVSLLTARGLVRIRVEYEKLISIQRPEIVTRLRETLEGGRSVVDNEAYTMAMREKELLDGRIVELETVLKQAKVVEESGGESGVVEVGGTVVVEVDGCQSTYTIVGSLEVDGLEGKISYESPLGAALLGRKVGDGVEIEVPAGILVYRILEVS